MSANEHLASLGAILRQLSDACEQLHRTLTTEASAISSRDLTLMASCGETKQTQLQNVESLEVQRQQALTHLGWSDQQEYPDQQLADAWSQVLERLQTCQDANDVNGAMLHAQQQHVETTLALMAGNDGGSKIYQADGTAARTSSNLPIAKA